MKTDNTIKILVVDDDPHILSATAKMVRSAGYEVIVAETGSDALEEARTHLPDLIVLDVMLPDMDGLEVCNQIKEAHLASDPLIIMASGMRTSGDDQSDGLLFGADDYLSRPFKKEELLLRISFMLKFKEIRDDLKQENSRLLEENGQLRETVKLFQEKLGKE
ncbi:MAG: response regulator transcription factor [SAR324 cluster bacterium]|nr:response regulator transcription factor [SAR324 cluster bacterium]